jgi:hypothetical protein
MVNVVGSNMTNTLYEWVKDLFKDGVELFSDEILITNDKGISLKRNTKLLRELSLGIISSNDSKEWYRICRLNSPVGTIIEDYNESEWSELYDDITALVRNRLTKELLKERGSKAAQTLLNILSKRDKGHWGEEQKSTQVKATTDNGINLEFTVVS